MSGIFIVGSGSSAAAAAAALVARGYRPTVLDVGLGPEPHAVELKNELAASPVGQWRAEALRELKTMDGASLCGIPRKRWFGSDFPFRHLTADRELEPAGVSISRSYARGGFSNVWGAAFRTVDASDIADWPFGPDELTPHYESVRSLMGLNDNGTEDTTRSSDPAHPPDSLRLSYQARAVLENMKRHRARLAGAGIRFEPSRLAVRNGDREDGCRYCGLCLFGCPYDCIYSASRTITELLTAQRIDYVPGVFVEKLQSRQGRVRIQVWDIREKRRRHFEASLVLVGAGVLSTARIMLESLGRYERPLTIRHSEHFTLPFFLLRGSNGVFEEALHTLCQLFVEIEDRHLSPRRIHLQLYTYNDLYLDLMRDRLGSIGSLLDYPLRQAASRLLAIFGYLPSDISSSMDFILRSEGSPGILLRGRPNRSATAIPRRVGWKLLRHWRDLGGMPLVFRTVTDLPGGGYHSGATFPMSEIPQFPRTDLLGRLPQFEHVHLIDASVLPSIPAVPTAVTVMANAHRIASLCVVPS